MRVSCGPAQDVRVLTPRAVRELDSAFEAGPASPILTSSVLTSPVLAGISVVSDTREGAIPASQACGMFIEWTP
jgi:hypothetical protein